MSTPETPTHTPELDERSYYDRDLLREQMTTLRKEAAQRAKLEKAIETKFHEESAQLNVNTEEKIQAIKDRCTTQIVSLNADFEKDKRRLEGQVQAQQATLDKQKKGREEQILREWEEVEKEKTDDLEFEALSAGESLKQQKEDAERKTSRLIESLAQTIEQLDNDLKKFQDKLVQWNVATASSLLPTTQENTPDGEFTGDSVHVEPTGPSLPEGKELIEYLKTLIEELKNDAKAMRALPSVRWAFSDGVTASIIITPCILAGLLAAAVAVPLTMSESDLPITIIAVITGLVTLLGGLSGGFFWQSGKKKMARAELETRVKEFSEKRQLLTLCHTSCLDVIAEKLERDKHKLDKRYERDMEKKHGGHAAGSASAGSKKEVAVATLQEKYEAGCNVIKDKRARGLAVLDETYPPKIKAIEAKGREKIDAIKADCEEKQKQFAGAKDKRWQEMTDRWRSTREQTDRIFSAANVIDSQSFPAWEVLSDGSAQLPETTPPGIRFGHLDLSMKSIDGGLSQHASLNSFGPSEWQQPAFIPCPDQAALLIKSTPEEKEAASSLLQAVMLRIASGLPPGQSRFTIIDPLGLGKQFAGFMHLADHD